MSDGTVECWGDNARGQLGNGSTTNSSTPVQVTGLSNIQAISRGVSHNCALDASGNVYCWGDGVTTPEFVLSGASAISAGGNHTCALMTTGTVECWGFNGTLLGGVNGELGNGSTGNSLTPVTVTGISNAVAVEGGVTFPAIQPVLNILVLLTLVGSFQLFDLPFILYADSFGNGPNNAALSIVTYLYQTGFRSGDLGYASAIGWVLTLVLVAAALLHRRLSRHEEAGS